MKNQVTVYDGGNCIGGNKIHLKAGDTGVFLDFGMNFKTYGMYFEEFLNPRTSRGIHDFLALGLLPPFASLYRDDLFPGDIHIGSDESPKVDAVFLSHAHVDHTGNIGFLKTSIPVFSSHMTAVICKAMQDCGRSSVEGEIAYCSPRGFNENNPAAISMLREPRQARTFFGVDEDVSELGIKDYWTRSFSSRSLVASPIEKASGQVGDLKFEAIPVDHSIFGAACYVFDVGGKSFAYTGDFRLHGLRQDMTNSFVNRLKEIRPDTLMIEGTNVGGSKGNDTIENRRASEEDVYQNCLKAMQEAEGRLVVADFGPRNIERLQIFLGIAHETQRRLVVTAKDAFLLQAMRLADPNVPDILADPSILIFDEVKASMGLWEKDFIRESYASHYIGSPAIRKDQSAYILAFSFFDIKHLLDVMPEGGVYIYSTCEAFSEEMELDVWRLGNWLEYLGIEPVGFKIESKGGEPGEAEINFIPGYHASGHVSENELFELIREVKPKTVIPVHTEHPEVFADKLGRDFNVVIPQNAVPIGL